MPVIPTYTAKDERLTPSPLGASAWETAARRIGPLYNEKAQFQKAQGAAIAAGFKDQLWPLRIQKLWDEQAAQAAQTGGAGGGRGGGFRSKGFDSDPFNQFGTHDHQQISRGMGALGQIAGQGTVGYGSGFADRSLFGRPLEDIDAQSARDLAAQKAAQRAIDAYNNNLFNAQQAAAAKDVKDYNDAANKWANEGYRAFEGGGGKETPGAVTDFGTDMPAQTGYGPAATYEPSSPYQEGNYPAATGIIPRIIQGLQDSFAPAAIAEGSQAAGEASGFSGGAGGY